MPSGLKDFRQFKWLLQVGHAWPKQDAVRRSGKSEGVVCPHDTHSGAGRGAATVSLHLRTSSRLPRSFRLRWAPRGQKVTHTQGETLTTYCGKLQQPLFGGHCCFWKSFFWAGQKIHSALSTNKRHIFHFHQELCWTTYSLTERTIWPIQLNCSGAQLFQAPNKTSTRSFGLKSILEPIATICQSILLKGLNKDLGISQQPHFKVRIIFSFY